MIDNLLICFLASGICYCALHCEYFTHDFSNDEYKILWQDFVCMFLFLAVNFCYIGYFRITMVYVKWKSWQVIFYKIMIILSSLTYFT
jgi:hypothetical protein